MYYFECTTDIGGPVARPSYTVYSPTHELICVVYDDVEKLLAHLNRTT